MTIDILCTTLGQLKYAKEETNPNIKIVGIDENNLDVYGFDIKSGRNFSAAEALSGNKKIILGMDLVKKLFDGKAERAVRANDLSRKFKI